MIARHRSLPVTLVSALIVAAGAILAPAAGGAAKHPQVTVMTRNLYLGANLLPLAAAPPEHRSSRPSQPRSRTSSRPGRLRG